MSKLFEMIGKTVQLKPAGMGSVYKGLCPFHEEKTPSFVFDDEVDRFHCYSCGKSGGEVEFELLMAEVRP